MRTLRIACIALAALNGPAIAGPVEDRISLALDKTLAEWTALVSCTALDPQTQAVLGQAWSESMAKTDALLKEKGVDAGSIKSVKERLAGLKPVMTKDAPAAELITYCHAQGDWLGNLNRFEITKPEDAVKSALGEVK
jgi:hypothetical protein